MFYFWSSKIKNKILDLSVFFVLTETIISNSHNLPACFPFQAACAKSPLRVSHCECERGFRGVLVYHNPRVFPLQSGLAQQVSELSQLFFVRAQSNNWKVIARSTRWLCAMA